MNSTMRSGSLRDARRAGLKTTISHFIVSARHAAKIAIEKVFPKRRGVEMSTSEEHLSQPFFFMMAGRCVPQSSLYSTRAVERSNAL